jgi:hypothetical protein
MTEQSKCNQRTGRHETQHILGKLGHVDHVASVLSVSMNIHKYNIYMEQLNGGKNHIVRTVPKCHKNNVEIGKIDTLTLKYMTAHFPGLIPALQ